ncbi:MAG: sulfatase [Planctomycetota bacterium]
MAGVLTLLAAACGSGSGAERPNVVLVLLDTLRPDHLELYGYPEATAPYLSALGDDSAVFLRAHSSSAWTPPSTATVFTGLYPTNHGMVHGFETPQWVQKQIEAGNPVEMEIATLPVDHDTLPQRLKAAGYATYGVTTNVHINQYFGFDRGFDWFEHHEDEKAGVVAEMVLAKKEELLAGEEPYFLYLHLNDVHKPYEAQAPWYRGSEDHHEDVIARYNSEISYVDDVLARLHRELAWDDNTVVCFVSDHGEAFLEHGYYGHGSTIHSELNRVLFLVHGPGVAPGRIELNVSLVDVAPTLLELAGVALTGSLDGLSLRHVLRGESRADAAESLETRWLFAHRRGLSKNDRLNLEELGKDHWSVVRGDWRLIENQIEGTLALYHLPDDPFEQADVGDQHPDVREELLRLLRRFQEQGIREAGSRVEVTMDEELLRELEKMGYVGGDG